MPSVVKISVSGILGVPVSSRGLGMSDLVDGSDVTPGIREARQHDFETYSFLLRESKQHPTNLCTRDVPDFDIKRSPSSSVTRRAQENINQPQPPRINL